MPALGGNVFAETSSYSLTHHEGERITLHAEFSPGELEYHDVLKMALRVGSGSNDPSVVENSLVVTEYSMSFSSSVDPNIDPSIPTVFSDDLNFDKALDCQPLLNNYNDARTNRRLMDVDYSTGLLTPSNWQQIIDYSASRASVPESNYTILASSRPRYFGVRGYQQNPNEWTGGDIGTYGKLPIIEIARGYLAYFNRTNDLYPLLNNTTQYNIQYLIGQDGIATQPKLSDITLYNVQGTFDSYPLISKGTVSLNTEDSSALNTLNGLVEFKKVTQKPTPVIYTQKSGIFPNYTFLNGTAYTGSGIDLIGNEPVDPTIVPDFANYSSLAEDQGLFLEQTDYVLTTLESTQRTPTTNLGPNIVATFPDGGNTINVYDTSTGVLNIPNNDTGSVSNPIPSGNGNPTSQPYDLEMEIGVDTTPLVYEIQTSNAGKGGGYNTSADVGSVNFRFERTTSGGPTNTSFQGFQLEDLKVKCVNYIQQAQGGVTTFEVDFLSSNSNAVTVNSSQGVTIIFNTTQIKGTLPPTYEAVQLGGPLLKQRWLVSGKVPASYIRQGRRFRIQSQGDLINPTANQRDQSLDPKFAPNSYNGGFQYKIDLQGQNSNPVTAAVPPYWIFKDTIGDGSGDIIPNKLIMSSSQMNKGYGRGFIQKDLIYTASLNKDFPDGIEPGYATFPTIETPWSLQPFDEIRFNNDENQNYVITEVISPQNQTTSSYINEGVGSLEITLNRDVPVSFEQLKETSPGGEGIALDVLATSSTAVFDSTNEVVVEPESKSTPQLVKTTYPQQIFRPLDFFVIRRYVDEASSIITTQKYPYENPPITGSSTGFLFPEYPAGTLKTNPDEILSDLVDKKLVE